MEATYVVSDVYPKEARASDSPTSGEPLGDIEVCRIISNLLLGPSVHQTAVVISPQ